MARNIEIKARVSQIESIQKRAEALSDTPGKLLNQEDTFFHVPKGRLKLRVTEPDSGQLIYYERDDTAGPKLSNYYLSFTSEPESLKNVLTQAFGIKGIVRKERWLYWVGNTRIHLDDVEGLGTFMELEVILDPGQSIEAGQDTADRLMSKLGVKKSALIKGAYIDLLTG